MTTLSSIRTLVRRDLKDEESANYRWTDAEIDRAIEKAVLDYSEYCPLQVKSTLATVDGSQSVDISTLAGRVDVLQVEHPVGQVPPSFVAFTVWGDVLTFRGSYEGDGANCCVYWLKQHTLGTGSTIPTVHESIIAVGACAYAISSLAQYKSDTANTGGPNVDRDLGYWARDRFKQFYTALNLVRNYNYRKLSITQLLPEE
jgi:hypothetical protein